MIWLGISNDINLTQFSNKYSGIVEIEVDRATFESFNELYKARNEEDIKGRKIERDINDYKENMDRFKNRKS